MMKAGGEPWSKLSSKLAACKNDIGAALVEGRQYMFTLGWLISSVLLALDAHRDGDSTLSEVAERWIVRMTEASGSTSSNT